MENTGNFFVDSLGTPLVQNLDVVVNQALEQVDQYLEPLSPLIERCSEFSQNVDDGIVNFLDSNGVAMPVDQLKYMLCILCVIPFALGFKWTSPVMPSVLKHTFSIMFSLSLCCFCLGRYAWFHSFFSALITYLCCLVMPRKYVGGIVFLWAMVYMSASHIYRMRTDYMGWSMDFTGPQMLITQKLIFFAMSYSDGRSKPLSKEESQKLPRLMQDLNNHKARYGLQSLPNPLAYYGYIYFFPSFLAGPSLEYRDYEDFIQVKNFDRDSKGNVSTPWTVVPALITFVKALMVFVPTMVYMLFLDVSFLISPQFMELPVHMRFFWGVACTAFSRWRYYFAWYLAEISFISSGYSYEKQKDGSVKWNRATNAYPLKVEFAFNTRDITSNWNLCTAHWLKNYIYLRLTPASGASSQIATNATYFVSAFWHGFYPGYYLFFLLTGFQTEVARQARRRLRPFFVTGVGRAEKGTALKPLYDIFTYLCTLIFVNFGGAAFLLLSFDSSIAYWSSVYYYGVIITFIAFLYFTLVPPKRATKPKTA